MARWTNYGDENYLEWGGCLVKPHWNKKELKKYPELKHQYDVFYLNTEVDGSGEMCYAALCMIDLTDDWLDYNGMLYAIGREDLKCKSFDELLEIISPELLAKELVEYHGIGNCNPTTLRTQYPSNFHDFVFYKEDIKYWLKQLRAGKCAGF